MVKFGLPSHLRFLERSNLQTYYCHHPAWQTHYVLNSLAKTIESSRLVARKRNEIASLSWIKLIIGIDPEKSMFAHNP